MTLQSAVEALLVGPVILVWVMALRDVLRRTAGRKRRRVLLVVPLLLFPPLSVPFLLTRPVNTASRRAVRPDDPRAGLVDLLERSAGPRHDIGG